MSETLKNLLIKLSELFNNQNSTTYVLLIFIAALLISFGFGFLYGFKWTIFKISAIVITIVSSIIIYGALSSYINNSQDSDIRSLKGVIPLLVSLLSIIIYLSARSLFFVVNNILHFIPKFKRKRKTAKHKWLKRVSFGITNAISTIPAGLLMANVMLISSKNEDSSTNTVSNIGVKIMTGGKGESFASLFSKVDDFQKVVEGLSDSTLWSKNYSTLSKEEKERVDKALSEISKVINNDRIFDIVIPVLREKSKELKIEKNLEDIVDKAISRMSAERPDYLTANSDEKKREILTDYLTQNIDKLYNEAKTLDSKLDDKIYIIKNVAANLEDKTQKNLVEKLDEIVESESLRKKADVGKSLNIFIKFLKDKAKSERPQNSSSNKDEDQD